MNIYNILKLFGNINSPRVKLAGLWMLHIMKRRYIGIYIDPVLSCNFRCRMCYFSDENRRKELHGKMKMKDIGEIADALFHRALKLQIGCGAEPTLYPALPDIIKLGKQHGVPYISLTTNGSLLNEEKLEALTEAGLDEITLSTHGIKKSTYEYLMANGSHEHFTALLAALRNIKNKYPQFKTRINYTINEDNTEELKDFWNLFKDIRIDILQIRPIQKIGESEYQNFALEKTESIYRSIIGPLLEECKRRNVTCLVPSEKSFRAITTDSKDNNSIFEELTYCYISPSSCWHDDFDFHTDTFESYSKRKHTASEIAKSVFSPHRNMTHKNVTRKMNYTVK